ncbi:hypothetical protein [Helicobacter pylori]|uniref:hypothetical protein n=1 Tax=Helicobacter pylori TaxID=210 RepID=UPI0018EC390C|nr:hypothetical protein [Helicobacter pylori]
MNALKKLSFCALLSLGLFAQTAHAHSLKDTINYPDWLKVNLFNQKNPPNQYVGSASISGKRNDFYANYIPYDDKLPPEKNAEKVAFLRAKMNAYSSLESVLITTKMHHRIVKALQVKNNVISHLFGLVDFLTSKSILAKRFVDTTNHRVYVMVQFPFIQPEDLIAYFKAKRRLVPYPQFLSQPYSLNKACNCRISLSLKAFAKTDAIAI